MHVIVEQREGRQLRMKTRVIGTPGSSLSRLIAFAESLNDKTLVELFQCFGSPPLYPHSSI